jgi:ketosteroid isomerase-like protein
MTSTSGTETQEFLDRTLPRQIEAERAIHNGEVAPRLAMWSRHDPLTLFGAWISGSGWAELKPVFDQVAANFSDCTSYDVELLAAGASGDLAYTVCYEHTTASVNGRPRKYTLRVTHVYRREGGEWKTVHRHGDELSREEDPAPEPSTASR